MLHSYLNTKIILSGQISQNIKKGSRPPAYSDTMSHTMSWVLIESIECDETNEDAVC